MASDRPARGTRPPNRRQLIVDAAGELFCQHGYDGVAMSDIAEAVAIGPSALYRHFRGKNDLLATVIEHTLGELDSLLRDVDDGDVESVLAQFPLKNRSIGMLWRRAARQLTSAHQERIFALLARIRKRVADALRLRRSELSRSEAELLAWCAIGVAHSVSFHRVSLPEAKFTVLLRKLIDIVLAAPVHLPSRKSIAPPAPNRPHTRREAILAAATILFAEKGYGSVSIDDIGAAVGIAGPSIYNHFPTKSAILCALVSRGNDWLWVEFNRAMACGAPGRVLSRAIRSYQELALNYPELLDILLFQSSDLPEADKEPLLGSQRAYVDEWVHLARSQHPRWTSAEAYIRVQAHQIMINDVAMIEALRNLAGVDCVLLDIGEQLLQTGG